MKFESVPPVTVTLATAGATAVKSAAVNEVLAAESVKVINAVWLFRSVEVLEVMETVGETVLTARASEAAAVLTLPAASLKAPAATAMLAAPLKLALGVKTAV